MKRRSFLSALAGLFALPALPWRREARIQIAPSSFSPSWSNTESPSLALLAGKRIDAGMFVCEHRNKLYPAKPANRIVGIALNSAKHGEPVKVLISGTLGATVSTFVAPTCGGIAPKESA